MLLFFNLLFVLLLRRYGKVVLNLEKIERYDGSGKTKTINILNNSIYAFEGFQEIEEDRFLVCYEKRVIVTSINRNTYLVFLFSEKLIQASQN